MESIVDEWTMEWKALVSPKELSDDEAGPPTYALVELASVHDSDWESREESLRPNRFRGRITI